MMHFGLNTAGPDSPRGLVSWVIRREEVAGGVSYVTIPFRSSEGNDQRGIMALGVMRSLVDSAAANTLTKYERTVATIHDNLETQATRDDALQDIKEAIRESVANGEEFLSTNWACVIARLDRVHTLNPRMTDASNAIEHLGGMQLHLTSRKKRRVENDADHEYEEIAHHDAQDHDIAMMHMHAPETYRRKFITFVVNATNCLYQMESTRAVAIVAPTQGQQTVSTADKEFYYIECDGDDCGMQKIRDPNVTDKLFATPNDGPQWFRKVDRREIGVGGDVYEQLGGSKTHIMVLDDHHVSRCMTDIVLPASMATRLLSGPYPNAVRKVQAAMEHVSGFATGDMHATAIAKKVRTHLEGSLKPEEWKILCLTPSAHGATPDFTLDLDQPDGWAIGFSPSEHTDAAEAVQAFLAGRMVKVKPKEKTECLL